VNAELVLMSSGESIELAEGKIYHPSLKSVSTHPGIALILISKQEIGAVSLQRARHLIRFGSCETTMRSKNF
jgi:hypothetical protein